MFTSGSSSLVFGSSAEHPIGDELRSLVAARDHQLLLRRSAVLAERARSADEPEVLAGDLHMLALEGPT